MTYESTANILNDLIDTPKIPVENVAAIKDEIDEFTFGNSVGKTRIEVVENRSRQEHGHIPVETKSEERIEEEEDTYDHLFCQDRKFV